MSAIRPGPSDRPNSQTSRNTAQFKQDANALQLMRPTTVSRAKIFTGWKESTYPGTIYQ